MRAFDRGQLQNNTRFVAYNPHEMSRLVIKALEFVPPERSFSFDLGCGNGGWTLMAAAAGLPSCGIDISSFLITHAERNYRAACEKGCIEPAVRCEFAVGNMYPPTFRTADNEPATDVATDNAYRKLGIAVEDAGIVYAYAWRTEMPRLCRFLAESVRPKTILILPRYGKADLGPLRSQPLESAERHFYIGRAL